MYDDKPCTQQFLHEGSRETSDFGYRGVNMHLKKSRTGFTHVALPSMFHTPMLQHSSQSDSIPVLRRWYLSLMKINSLLKFQIPKYGTAVVSSPLLCCCCIAHTGMHIPRTLPAPPALPPTSPPFAGLVLCPRLPVPPPCWLEPEPRPVLTV